MYWSMYNPNNPGSPYPETMTETYGWDNEGKMTSMGAFDAYQYDSMGRLNGMTVNYNDGYGPWTVASAAYGPAGQLLSLTNTTPGSPSSSVSESFSYNALLQMTSMTTQPNVVNMQYNYSSTQNNGRITSSNDYVTGENVSYTYDALNRLSGASAGRMWGEAYSYDGFGNLTGKTVTQAPAPALGVSYDANNHQRGLTYDANGNQLWDAQHATAYGWNMENKLVTETSQGWPGAETWYSYDAFGRRVMKDVNADPNGENGGLGYTGGSWECYFYGITGQKLMTSVCTYNSDGTVGCSEASSYLYFGSRLIQANGALVVTDRLGSVRAKGVGGAWTQMSYFPYGEERTSTPDGTEKFGTYYRDGPGQDYAEQRYYNNGTGRFWSVDPGGIATADMSDPTSLNRYAYVGGDPINFADRHGRNRNIVGSCNDLLNGNPQDGCDDGSGDYEGGSCTYGPLGFEESPLCSDYVAPVSITPPPPPDEAPPCDQLLTSAVGNFLAGKGSPLASDASEIVLVAQNDNIDPTLVAAIAIAENGQKENNPFALGPDGSNTYPGLDAAINAVGSTLHKYIYTYNESTVSALWSGNTWIVNPKKPWITIQPPGYCVGETAAEVAKCQKTGNTISGFMKNMGATATVGGNPNKVGFPCPD
jgi:RHS repeat-associated protein